MISNILQSIVIDLNQFFKSKFNLDEDQIIISSLQNLDGSVPFLIENKMVCSIMNS